MKIILPWVLVIAIGIATWIAFPRISNELQPVIGASALVSISITIVVAWLLKKDNDYQKNIISIFGVGIIIISWFANSYFNNVDEKKRNQLNHEQSTKQAQRDIRVKFLLDAYFRLENSGYRDTFLMGHRMDKYDQLYLKYSESALSLIQLLGEDSTIKLASEFAISGGRNQYRNLLIALRNDLRHELSMDGLPSLKEYGPTHFRIFRKASAPNHLTAEQEFELTVKLNELNRELIK